MSNSIAPGSSADVNVRVTALTTNPNVPVTYKTIILKKNLVNGVNTLTQEMMSATNVKYVIKYDYVLAEDITIPTNCVLEFDGGSLSSENNRNILFQNTRIVNGLGCFNNIIIDNQSTFFENVIYADWFITDSKRNLDCSAELNMVINYSCQQDTNVPKIILDSKTYYIKNIVSPTQNTNGTAYVNLVGNTNFLDHSDRGTTIKTHDDSDIDKVFGTESSFACGLHIENVTFNANNKSKYAFHKSSISESTFINCCFKDAKEICFWTENSYIVNIEDCFFKSAHSKTRAWYGLFLGTGLCNIININNCWFENLEIGIYLANGFNINITGCTIEGISRCGIITSTSRGLNIDGCYFEDVAEGRNVYEDTEENIRYNIGLSLTSYEGTNKYFDNENLVICNHGHIYSSILIGCRILYKTWPIKYQTFLNILNEDQTIPSNFIKYSNGITIKNCTHSVFINKGEYYFNDFGAVAFVSCCGCVVGMDIHNNSITILNDDYDDYKYYCSVLNRIILGGKSSVRDFSICNNGNNSILNKELINYYFYPLDGSPINYILTLSPTNKIYPILNLPLHKINYSTSQGTPVEYIKGRYIVQESEPRSFTIDNIGIKAGDTIVIGFFARYGGGDGANMSYITINGKQLVIPLTLYYQYYTIQYTAEADFTLSEFTMYYNGTFFMRWSPEVDLYILQDGLMNGV